MHTLRFVGFTAVLLAGALPAQLSGTYFINATLPLTPLSFPSFADATAALAAQGVSGPVDFLIFDDGGPFDEASPFATNNGTYGTNDAVLVMTSWTGASPTNRITFRAAPGERPVLDATGRAMGVFWGGADYVTLEGLEIANASFDGISLYAESQHGVANDPIIDSCRIHDCNGTAITIYGNSSQPANTLVQNCTMWRCQLTGGGAFSTTGRFGYIATRRTNGTRIVHNTFYVDTLTDNSSYCVLGARPSSVSEVPYAEVSNNVFVKLAGPMAPLFRFQSVAGSSFPTPAVCDSNCFLDGSGGSFAIYGNPLVTAATLTDWQIGATLDLNSLAADPLLRDPANADFHLTASSPCIGGSTVAAGVAVDFDGQARTSPADIGADEFSAADFTSVGAGCPGTGGIAPELLLYGWPFLGNPDFAVGLEQMPGNTLAVVFAAIGTSAVPIPIGGGCEVLIDPGTALGIAALPAGPAGTGSVVLPLPSNATLVGFNIAYQGVVLDAGAALGLTTTNAIDIVLDF